MPLNTKICQGVSEADMAMNDNTTGDASVSSHGFLPKLPNDATKFLNGIGGFSIPALSVAMQYAIPTTGQTVTCTGGRIARLLIDPAGTLLALTIALPSSPTDGDEQSIASSQVLTGVTITGTITGTLTTLAAGAFATFKWNAASSKWFRIA